MVRVTVCYMYWQSRKRHYNDTSLELHEGDTQMDDLRNAAWIRSDGHQCERHADPSEPFSSSSYTSTSSRWSINTARHSSVAVDTSKSPLIQYLTTAIVLTPHPHTLIDFFDVSHTLNHLRVSQKRLSTYIAHEILPVDDSWFAGEAAVSSKEAVSVQFLRPELQPIENLANR